MALNLARIVPRDFFSNHDRPVGQLLYTILSISSARARDKC